MRQALGVDTYRVPRARNPERGFAITLAVYGMIDVLSLALIAAALTAAAWVWFA
jgi:hypothetical protein